MDPKPKPNREKYLDTLRAMGPQKRLAKAFELTEDMKRVFRAGLQKRNPTLTEHELHELYLRELAKCHNRNY